MTRFAQRRWQLMHEAANQASARALRFARAGRIKQAARYRQDAADFRATARQIARQRPEGN